MEGSFTGCFEGRGTGPPRSSNSRSTSGSLHPVATLCRGRTADRSHDCGGTRKRDGLFLAVEVQYRSCQGRRESPSRNAGLFGFNHARAYVLVLQRDYTRAEQLLQSIDVTEKPGNAVPDDGNELHRRGLTLERLGRIAWFRGDNEKVRGYFEAARQSFEQWLANKPPNDPWRESHALAYIAEIDAALGRKEDAIREARSAVAYCQAQHNPWGASADIQTLLAIAYMWSGERDAALQQLAAVAKLPAIPIVLVPGAVGLSAGELKLNPIWDELRNDPRFDNIIAEAAKPIEIKDVAQQF